MKFVLDTHTHTVNSGHAYSTVHDYINEAKRTGVELFGLTDHGPTMPGGPNVFHIANQGVIPRMVDGVIILKGAEANIIDFEGNIDIEEIYLQKLDVVIASLHDVTIDPGTVQDHMNAIEGAMKNKYVDIIGHSGNPMYGLDYEAFVLMAKKHNVLVEINNSSLKPGKRVGSPNNCKDIAKLCMKHGVKVIAGSDSHISYDLCKFELVSKMFDEIGMPEELVMNTSVKKFVDHLNARGKNIEL